MHSSIQLAGSWDQKRAHADHGAAGGWKERESHRAALGGLSKEKNGIVAEETEDKSRASLLLLEKLS